MEKYQIVLDLTMCCMWSLTYTLVLIGTIKYKFPLISPVTQAITAPFEFAVIYIFLTKNTLSFDYVSFSYLYWSIIEIVIIICVIKLNFIKKKHIFPYILTVVGITVVMCFLVSHQSQMLYFSYINTFIGEFIWLLYITKKDYPTNLLVISVFFFKFIADLVSIPVYFGAGYWTVNFICALLPMLDFAFIVIYFQKKLKN